MASVERALARNIMVEQIHSNSTQSGRSNVISRREQGKFCVSSGAHVATRAQKAGYLPPYALNAPAGGRRCRQGVGREKQRVSRRMQENPTRFELRAGWRAQKAGYLPPYLLSRAFSGEPNDVDLAAFPLTAHRSPLTAHRSRLAALGPLSSQTEKIRAADKAHRV